MTKRTKAPELKVPDLPHQAIGAFRSMSEVESSMPRNPSASMAVRIEIPWHLVVRRRVQAIVNFEERKP